MAGTFKKLVTAITAITLLFSVGGLTACKKGDDTVINAYEIAVKNGFVGTEAEWLASLKGAKGEDGEDFSIWEIYRQSEYEGTFIEFLKELGVSFDLQEDNDALMLAKNTSSVVSICCGFQKATQRLVGRDAWGRPQYENVTKVSGSEGSGVIWSLEENDTTASAYIVTNYHVIYQNASANDTENGISDSIYVYPYGALEGFTLGDSNGNGYLDGEEQMGDSLGNGIKATFVGGAMDYDVAVLKVENSAYLKSSAVSAVELGVSKDLILGEKSYVIGNSNGQGISITGGLISVLSESIYVNSPDGENRRLDFRVLRTDAAINHGNSGGALFNTKGELIGITNAKSGADDVDNMGYALPIDIVKSVVNNVMDNATATQKGFVSLARLGVVTTLQSSTSYLTESGEIRTKEDFRVTQVVDGGCAGANTQDNKCLKFGDVLLSGTLNGKTVTFEQRYLFQEQLLDVRKGDTITYKVKRESETIDVEITFDKDEYFIKYA